MNSDVETRFIQTFINKRFRERLSFELNSKKKRLCAIDRFSHGAETLIEKSRLVEKTVRLNRALAEEYAFDAPVYVLSRAYFEGIFMEYAEAIEYLTETPSCAIAVFGAFCIIRSESERDEAAYYILREEKDGDR